MKVLRCANKQPYCLLLFPYSFKVIVGGVTICSGVSYCCFFRSNAFPFWAKGCILNAYRNSASVTSDPEQLVGEILQKLCSNFVALGWGCLDQMEFANHSAAKLKYAFSGHV